MKCIGARCTFMAVHGPSGRLLLQAEDPPSTLHAQTGGNLHQFTAQEACAVLDVLAPPYDTHDAGDCYCQSFALVLPSWQA